MQHFQPLSSPTRWQYIKKTHSTDMHVLDIFIHDKQIQQQMRIAANNLAQLHRHRAHRHNRSQSSTITTLQAAYDSASLEKLLDATAAPRLIIESLRKDALRANDLISANDENQQQSLIRIFRRSPYQVVAKIHAIAAYTSEEKTSLGQPLNRYQSARTEMLHEILVTHPESVPPLILSAIVHAEIMSLSMFSSHNGIVARTVGKLISCAYGADPYNLSTPESLWNKNFEVYRERLSSYQEGTFVSVKNWILEVIKAYSLGALHSIELLEKPCPPAGE